jgi:hypothetical protein
MIGEFDCRIIRSGAARAIKMQSNAPEPVGDRALTFHPFYGISIVA